MLIGKALIHGIILSVGLCGWILIILRVNPRFEMKSYPKEILDNVDKQTKKEKIGFVSMALPGMLLVIGYILFSLVQTYQYKDISLIMLFSQLFISFMVWNLVDLLVMDWLLFCKINPNFMILPGTKGNSGYKNYKYHFIGFIKGIFICLVGAVILAMIAYFILI
jgi:hypothetical protein